MAERPDLDAIEADMQNPMFYGSPRSMLKLHSLLTYCRELEAENKRLNNAMDDWIRKWTFEGGIYDDAPRPPK